MNSRPQPASKLLFGVRWLLLFYLVLAFENFRNDKSEPEEGEVTDKAETTYSSESVVKLEVGAPDSSWRESQGILHTLAL